MAAPKKSSQVSDALDLLHSKGIDKGYVGNGHYTTGSGTLNWGGQTFHYSRGVVINTSLSHKPQNGKEWRIVAYHGTEWVNLNSILKNGLLPGNPKECLTFNGAKYGKGVYCSPYQSYAKLYHRGSPEPLKGGGKVRLVLGLRIRNAQSITKTKDQKIWVIKNENDVAVQDINLTYE